MVGVGGGRYLSPSEYVKHGFLAHNPDLRLVAVVSGVSPRHVFCPTFLCVSRQGHRVSSSGDPDHDVSMSECGVAPDPIHSLTTTPVLSLSVSLIQKGVV